jgi:hypothetical protein
MVSIHQKKRTRPSTDHQSCARCLFLPDVITPPRTVPRHGLTKVACRCTGLEIYILKKYFFILYSTVLFYSIIFYNYSYFLYYKSIIYIHYNLYFIIFPTTTFFLLRSHINYYYFLSFLFSLLLPIGPEVGRSEEVVAEASRVVAPGVRRLG